MQELTLNSTRIRIISHLEILLIFNELTQTEVDLALTVLNQESFTQIAEERVSMNKCCNLKCKAILPADHVMRVVSRKFNIHKKGFIEHNTDPRVFCGKVKPSDKSECEDHYTK